MPINQRIAPEFLVSARTMNVQQFFANTDFGLFTPMLWPEFDWSHEQVTRFANGISSAVLSFTDDPSAIHYAGSMIVIDSFDHTEAVKPVDSYAMPIRIYTVVDGLNRLTIYGVIGCLLYQRMRRLRNNLAVQGHSAACNRVDSLQELLLKLFSCEVPGARPQTKPRFVHGRSDFWGNDDYCYRSSTSEFFAASLAAIWDEAPAPKTQREDAFSALVTTIDNWLDAILAVHANTDFPTVWQIRSGLHWLDPVLFTDGTIAVAAANPADPTCTDVGAFVKLFALIQTLFQRCCFTVATPTTADASATVLALYDDLIRYY